MMLFLLLACSPEATDKPTNTPALDTDSAGDTAPGDDTAPPGDTGEEPEPEPEEGWNPDDFAVVYEVGPEQAYAEPDEVPWESLGPSTLVRIHWREAPYRSKWVLNTAATEDEPLVVVGVPGSDGALPVVSGDGASTRLALDYWSESRAVIKVGGSSLPAEPTTPAWITIEGLDIRSAHPDYTFTDDAGNTDAYSDNAAAVFVEAGDHITVRGCVLTDAGNGLFVASQSRDVRIVGNHIHGNGIADSFYEHNSYTESQGILFEGNRYGPLRAGALGNNLKDRSAGTIIRYNWIEAGNRQLDLVDSGSSTLIGRDDYRVTVVTGNVLVDYDDGGNGQVVHYGGDSSDTTRYRAGTLLFEHNTVVSHRAGSATLVRLSTATERIEARNNLVYAAGRLGIVDSAGDALLEGNWLPSAWVESLSGASGTITDAGNLSGDDPGFADLGALDLSLAAGAACVDGGVSLAEAVTHEYVPHQQTTARDDSGLPDCGAFAR